LRTKVARFMNGSDSSQATKCASSAILESAFLILNFLGRSCGRKRHRAHETPTSLSLVFCEREVNDQARSLTHALCTSGFARTLFFIFEGQRSTICEKKPCTESILANSHSSSPIALQSSL